MRCKICPHECDIKRPSGICGQNELKVARVAPHFGEEPPISGVNGSGTIFFSGCSLRCVFCQNYEISHHGYGKSITVDRLCEIFKELENQSVHNINLVNPTHFTKEIITALQKYKPPIPIVWNSSGYEKAETIKQLEGLVDIYLPDLKYTDSEVSLKYSGVADYFKFAAPAVLEMARQQNETVYDGEILKKGLIIRHLILPSNTANSISVLRFIADNLPKVIVSLLSQYTPCGASAECEEINRRITKREYEKVLSVMEELELDGFVQELSSAGQKYIPLFDLTGV